MVATVAIPYLSGRGLDAIRVHDRHQLVTARPGRRRRRDAPPGPDVTRRLVAGQVSLGVEYDLRTRLFGHLQSLELGFFDHNQTGQLMSRATVDLQAVRFFLGYGLVYILQSALTIVPRRGAMLILQPASRSISLIPVPFVVYVVGPLRPAGPPGDPGGPAADRRADGRRRGEHLRRPGRQGIRPRGPPAGPLRAERRPGLRPGDGLGPPPGPLQPADRLPPAARPGRRAAGRRAPGDRPHADRRPVRGVLPLPADAALADADARPDPRPRPAGDGIGGADLPAARPRAAARPSAAGRAAAARRARPRPARGRRAPLRGRRPSGPARRQRSTSRPATTVALVGATGSGQDDRSPRSLARLYDPTAGRVTIDGADLREVSVGSVREAVALVSDEPFLFSATVHENIAYARPSATRDGGRGGGPAGAGPRLHPRPARRLRDPRRRAGTDPVGRAAPAPGDRPGPARRSAGPDPRRRDVVGRRVDRAGDQARPAGGDGRTDDVRDRPPPVDDRPRRRIAVLEDGVVAAYGTHAELLERSDHYREIVEKGLPDQRLPDAQAAPSRRGPACEPRGSATSAAGCGGPAAAAAGCAACSPCCGRTAGA